MKKVFLTAVLAGISYFGNTQVWVDGYTKSNGTIVQGHYRTEPNNTKLDNWTTKPNVNPYTGETGTKIVKDTYYNAPSYTTPTYTTPKRSKSNDYYSPIKF